MENARRNAYDTAFKLKAIELADKEGNRAAARKREEEDFHGFSAQEEDEDGSQ